MLSIAILNTWACLGASLEFLSLTHVAVGGLEYMKAFKIVTNTLSYTVAYRCPCISLCQHVCCHVPVVASTR